MDKPYDRMNPTIRELFDKLYEFGTIDYGTDAYQLSGAEARLIIQSLMTYEKKLFQSLMTYEKKLLRIKEIVGTNKSQAGISEYEDVTPKDD